MVIARPMPLAAPVTITAMFLATIHAPPMVLSDAAYPMRQSEPWLVTTRRSHGALACTYAVAIVRPSGDGGRLLGSAGERTWRDVEPLMVFAWWTSAGCGPDRGQPAGLAPWEPRSSKSSGQNTSAAGCPAPLPPRASRST